MKTHAEDITLPLCEKNDIRFKLREKMQEKAKIILIDQMALENLRMCSACKG